MVEYDNSRVIPGESTVIQGVPMKRCPCHLPQSVAEMMIGRDLVIVESARVIHGTVGTFQCPPQPL